MAIARPVEAGPGGNIPAPNQSKGAYDKYVDSVGIPVHRGV